MLDQTLIFTFSVINCIIGPLLFINGFFNVAFIDHFSTKLAFPIWTGLVVSSHIYQITRPNSQPYYLVIIIFYENYQILRINWSLCWQRWETGVTEPKANHRLMWQKAYCDLLWLVMTYNDSLWLKVTRCDLWPSVTYRDSLRFIFTYYDLFVTYCDLFVTYCNLNWLTMAYYDFKWFYNDFLSIGWLWLKVTNCDLWLIVTQCDFL